MAKIDLHGLYRKATASAPTLDVDTLARLAAGEHLGARHDAAIEALGASRAHAAALQVAQGSSTFAFELAMLLAAILAAAYVIATAGRPRVTHGPANMDSPTSMESSRVRWRYPMSDVPAPVRAYGRDHEKVQQDN